MALKATLEKINKKEISFASLGLYQIDQIKDYFGDLSGELIRIHLSNITLKKEDCKKIPQFFPKIKYFSVTESIIENYALVI